MILQRCFLLLVGRSEDLQDVLTMLNCVSDMLKAQKVGGELVE
jgi:hypothetical protein